MVIFLMELLFYTRCQVQCTQIGYQIVSEKKKHQELLSLQKDFEVKLTELKSPERIIGIAKSQLGLDIPKPNQIRSLP